MQMTSNQLRRKVQEAQFGVLMGRLGFNRDSTALGSQWHALRTLADPCRSPVALLLALDGMDRDWETDLSQWSRAQDAAVGAGQLLEKARRREWSEWLRTELQARAERLGRKAEGELDWVTRATPWDVVRRLILADLEAMGVNLITPNGMRAARFVVQAIRGLRVLATVQRRDEHVQERIDDCVREIEARGLTVGQVIGRAHA
jgi:hypothetical protein